MAEEMMLPDEAAPDTAAPGQAAPIEDAPEAQPKAEVAAPTADAPAPEPDPIVAAQADIERLTKERDKLAEDLQRVTQEHTQLHLALDEERRKPSHEDLANAMLAWKSRAEKAELQLQVQQEQPPVAGVLSQSDLDRIKGVFLEALAEHAVLVAEEE